MATAPGAILAILHEYRARGPFTQRLLGVIAIDDALALVVYGLLLSRFGGKLFGTWLAARLTKSPAPVRKYLGLALLPQAGVSIGLILNAESFFAGEAKPTKTFHLRHF